MLHKNKASVFVYFVIAISFALVILLFLWERLDEVTYISAVKNIDYIREYYKINNEFPKMESLNRDVNFLFLKNKISVMYELQCKGCFYVSYYKKPVGPFHSFNSEKNIWIYEE